MPNPEEDELARKQALLADLENRLADRELELATLKTELSAFEQHYLDMIGRRYAELDALEALIAEALFRKDPLDHSARSHAETARARATESQQVIGALPPKSPKQPKDSDSLKALYRHAAKLLHPDLAVDPEQRDVRKQRMAEVNAAYEDGDEARIREIVQSWHASPESVEGAGTAADLVRIIRKIAQVEQRLNAIASEMELLRGGELYDLLTRVTEAAEQGRDLLNEMAMQIDGKIAKAKSRLQTISGVKQ